MSEGGDSSVPWGLRVAAGILAAFDLAVVLYVSYLVALFATWSPEEPGGAAAGLAEGWTGWLEQALWPLAIALGLALFLYIVNRLALASLTGRSGRRWAGWVAAGGGTIVLLAGLLSAALTGP